MRDDGGLDRRARDGGLAEANGFTFTYQQHLIQDDFRAHVRRYLFDLEFFAGCDLVLLAPGFYDRVHAVPDQHEFGQRRRPELHQRLEQFGERTPVG